MEKILQYIWQWRLYGSPDKVLTDGRRICIIDPGRLNTGSGPDFFNAKILIDGVEWAGNVEFHVKASDWHRHGHDGNEAYGNVVLHVVWQDDAEIKVADRILPQLVLDIAPELIDCYAGLMSGSKGVRCAYQLDSIPEIELSSWIETLGYERMIEKRQAVKRILRTTNGDWAATCFIILSRALGFNLNGDPFERVARSFPLSVSARHSDNIMQLEALVMGQAGLLDGLESGRDDYYFRLCSEYRFLASKYRLNPVGRAAWKMSGTRPANFPHRKLAYMATLLIGCHNLWNRFMEAHGDASRLKELLNYKFDGYWKEHYRFGEPAERASATAMGPNMMEVVLINAVAPLYLAYGEMVDARYEDHGFELLESLSPEVNSITRGWATLGIKADNAMRSQALIQLRKRYCDESKCMDCRIGCRIMRRRADALFDGVATV